MEELRQKADVALESEDAWWGLQKGVFQLLILTKGVCMSHTHGQGFECLFQQCSSL